MRTWPGLTVSRQSVRWRQEHGMRIYAPEKVTLTRAGGILLFHFAVSDFLVTAGATLGFHFVNSVPSHLDHAYTSWVMRTALPPRSFKAGKTSVVVIEVWEIAHVICVYHYTVYACLLTWNHFACTVLTLQGQHRFLLCPVTLEIVSSDVRYGRCWDSFRATRSDLYHND